MEKQGALPGPAADVQAQRRPPTHPLESTLPTSFPLAESPPLQPSSQMSPPAHRMRFSSRLKTMRLSSCWWSRSRSSTTSS